MKESKSKIYFPSINGVRAIAALLVIFHHIEQVKAGHDIVSWDVMKLFGPTGVTLFFVLSGFLITFLLYEERKETQNINVLQFYLRRILRIWPVYFFIIFISLLYDLYSNDWSYVHGFLGTKLFLYVFFLPNLCFILYGASGFPSQLWSVGSEEQFYLIWPHLVKRKMINSSRWILIFVAIFNLLRFMLYKLDQNYSVLFGGVDLYNLSWRFLYYFRVDCMAIGALGAYLYYNNKVFKPILEIIYSRNVQLLNMLCIILILFSGINLSIFRDTVFALLFIIYILNVATNNKSLVNMEFPVFNFLGKISYGLYVYHPLVIMIVVKWFKQESLLGQGSLDMLFTVVVLLFTIGAAYISYHYLESPFLRLKKKYSKIISGNVVQ